MSSNIFKSTFFLRQKMGRSGVPWSSTEEEEHVDSSISTAFSMFFMTQKLLVCDCMMDSFCRRATQISKLGVGTWKWEVTVVLTKSVQPLPSAICHTLCMEKSELGLWKLAIALTHNFVHYSNSIWPNIPRGNLPILPRSQLNSRPLLLDNHKSLKNLHNVWIDGKIRKERK